MTFQTSGPMNDCSDRSGGSNANDHNESHSVDGNDFGTNYINATAEVRQAMKGEDRGVFWWRLIVKVMMIVTAVLLTTFTYIQLKRSEGVEFRAGFASYSEIVISYAENELTSHSEALEAMTDLFATFALATALVTGEPDWPYVTIPPDEFEAHAEHVTTFSHDGIVWMTPIVEDVAAWDAYSSAVMNTSDIPVRAMFAYGDGGAVTVTGTGHFIPLHEVYPAPNVTTSIDGSIINYDTSSDPYVNETTNLASSLDLLVLSRLLPLPLIREAYPDLIDEIEPLSMLVEPIHASFDEESEIVGYIQSVFKWKAFFSTMEWDSKSIYCSIENTCGDSFSFLIELDGTTYIDSEDAIDSRIDDVSASAVIGIDDDDITLDEANAAGICIYTLTVYPAKNFRESYDLHAGLYSAVVGIAMFVMVGSFIAYDSFVRRRNEKVIKSAIQSTAIVTSMFPANVRDRLYKEQEEKENLRKKHGNSKANGIDFLSSSSDDNELNSKPLADLFTASTILFADIAGFTAWSSVREPYQVFTLLETLYAAFDAIATRLRIFKVETIGDCYVAVSGVPEPRADHAVAMCKFANAILSTMQKLTSQMETTLGPDTGDLALRIGLHSGPVTAGVLRGERARFQLFGDTMNTAARMEQTGIKNRIQISQATADCLIAGGKSNWFSMREDKVFAKGKGELTAYWLEMNSIISSGGKSNRFIGSGVGIFGQIGTDSNQKLEPMSEKLDRLIDWNTDVLRRLLQQVFSNRIGAKFYRNSADQNIDEMSMYSNKNPFDEVKEVISLPQTNKVGHKKLEDKSVMTSAVTKQLRQYVSRIANMYKNNEFHNFKHASHVAMSVSKLLSRIVAPVDVLNPPSTDFLSTSHDPTYGITSDPLTQFACVFSALIHDVDHAGVPNSQLVTENIKLAKRYDGKSIAEQNSIDLSWNLLMKDEYKDLRNAICATKSEFVRFRQLVVNVVMATDIMDKDLKNLRNRRWTKAFEAHKSAETGQINLSSNHMLDQVNRKATVVIEHMIQASDVSHTMQHWHVYRKWNELFFLECFDAYKRGRSLTDPSDTWYQGELNFFDFYIIPLAKKLQDCGVFGVSGAEYLQYAMNNRLEWQSRGVEIVAEMKEAAIGRNRISV